MINHIYVSFILLPNNILRKICLYCIITTHHELLLAGALVRVGTLTARVDNISFHDVFCHRCHQEVRTKAGGRRRF